MKRLLKSKAGVTILEGIIALGLLALIASGAFGVLLAASRQTSQPDAREEMALAVEKANSLLKTYVEGVNANDVSLGNLQGGLCGGDNNPLEEEREHTINCQLPPICDQRNSSFTYTVAGNSDPKTISFSITCKGYTL